jgi:hypothetical protein
MPSELKAILAQLTKIRGFAAGLVSGAVVSAVASWFVLGAPEATVLAALKEVSAQCVGYVASVTPEIVDAGVVDEGSADQSPVDLVNPAIGEVAEDGNLGALDLEQDGTSGVE